MNAPERSSPRRVWRTLFIAAAVIASLAVYSQIGLDEAAAPAEGIRAAEQPFNTLAPPVAGPEGEDELTARLEQPLPFLEVTVVDPSDQPVEEAAISALGPYDREKEATGSAHWERMAPGTWTVTAAAEGYFEETEAVNIRRGKDGEVVLKLRPCALVDGQVSNTYGRPMVATRIFFLRPDQPHPENPFDVGDLPFVMPDRGGGFVSPPLEEGDYRISLRTAGVGVLQSETVHIKEGERKTAEIRLQRGAPLTLEIHGELPAAEAKRGRVTLLKKDVRKRRRQGTTMVRWKKAKREDFGLDQDSVLFERIKDAEYRVLLEAGSARFESEESFVFSELEPLVVELQVPPGPYPAGEKVHPLHLSSRSAGSGLVPAAAGIFWKN